ncbi:MAG: hypothetical protein LBQ51_10685 [Desulfovibrio sp.]|jgi:hypothetical protein|nr:hypothetical protein [Desulfovibrio sp.]
MINRKLFYVGAYLRDPDQGIHDQEIDDWRMALRIPAVRRIVRSLLSTSNVTGPSLGADGAYSAFNEGVRAMGQHLLQRIESVEAGETARLMLESADDLVLDRPQAVTQNTEEEEDY